MSDDLKRDGIKNQIKGKGKEFEGKVRSKFGEVTGDSSEQLKGKAKEVEGKIQRKIGEAQRDSDD